MAQKQTITRTAKGLFSQFNRLESPPGALLLADNCVIDRPGVIEKRRGFKRYGTALSAGGATLLKFNKRLFVLDGTTLKYDSNGTGTWSNVLTGIYPPTDSRIGMVETLKSAIFTSSTGPYILDALGGTPRLAGILPGLDVSLVKYGIGDGWFESDSQVAYRIVWGKKDSNNQETIGEVSFREVSTNVKSATLNWVSSGGGPYTITVTHTAHGYSNSDIIQITDSSVVAIEGSKTITWIDANSYSFTVAADPGASGTLKDGKNYFLGVYMSLPKLVATTDFVEIYRTELSADGSTDPGDRLKFVVRLDYSKLTASGYSYYWNDTITDLGEDLYTNALKETILKNNIRPPYCKYMAQFKGHTWYANTTQAHTKDIRLTTITGITDDNDYINIEEGTKIRSYIFSTIEDPAQFKFKRYTAGSTMAENIRETVKSLCRVINRDPGNSFFYAQYASEGSDQPGILRITNIYLNPISSNPYTGYIFYLTANPGCGNKFDPALPISGTTIASTSDVRKNGLYHSKFEKPEAVPLTNVDNVGGGNYEILGITAIKDALIIEKEDGYYMMTGSSDGSSGSTFTLSQLDPTLKLLTANSLQTLDNSVYGVTTQGVVRTTESGSRIMSWPIEYDLNKLAQIANFKEYTHAIAYESARKYLLCTQEKSGDTETKIIWVYNYITDSWTRWKKKVSSGIVLEFETGGDKLYLAHNTDSYILEERKSLSASEEDYVDETLETTVVLQGPTTYNGKTVTALQLTYSYSEATFAAGWLFEYGLVEGIAAAVFKWTGNQYVVYLDREIDLPTPLFTAYLSIPIEMEVQWMPEAGGNAATMKQFPEGQIYFERHGGTHQIGFCADTQLDAEYSDKIEIIKSRGWGKGPWGKFGWGDVQPPPSGPIRAWVPRSHQHCRALRTHYVNTMAKEKVSILQMTLTIRPYSEFTMREPR